MWITKEEFTYIKNRYYGKKDLRDLMKYFQDWDEEGVSFYCAPSQLTMNINYHLSLKEVDEASRKMANSAYNQITHQCDGPLTKFVMISRAIELSRENHEFTTEEISEALDKALQDYA